jgi:hypothetical protein
MNEVLAIGIGLLCAAVMFITFRLLEVTSAMQKFKVSNRLLFDVMFFIFVVGVPTFFIPQILRLLGISG